MLVEFEDKRMRYGRSHAPSAAAALGRPSERSGSESEGERRRGSRWRTLTPRAKGLAQEGGKAPKRARLSSVLSVIGRVRGRSSRRSTDGKEEGGGGGGDGGGGAGGAGGAGGGGADLVEERDAAGRLVAWSTGPVDVSAKVETLDQALAQFRNSIDKLVARGWSRPRAEAFAALSACRSPMARAAEPITHCPQLPVRAPAASGASSAPGAPPHVTALCVVQARALREHSTRFTASTYAICRLLDEERARCAAGDGTGKTTVAAPLYFHRTGTPHAEPHAHDGPPNPPSPARAACRVHLLLTGRARCPLPARTRCHRHALAHGGGGGVGGPRGAGPDGLPRHHVLGPRAGQSRTRGSDPR